MDEASSTRPDQVGLAESYDEFYRGEPAPLSDVTAALWGEVK